MLKFFVARRESEDPYRGSPQVIVIGNFDGIHLGHQELLRKAKQVAVAKGLPAIAVTFDPHPRAILRPPHLRLFDLEDQQAQFEKFGLDGVSYLSFNRDFSALSAHDFLNQILGPRFHPAAIIVGFNFRFGSDRTGDVQMLKGWGQTYGSEVFAVPPFELDGIPVSTSEVRKALQAGFVKKASRMLGRPYSLAGIVVHGDARGRGIGFPTANVHLEKVVTPDWGVYATRSWLQGKVYDSVSHLGPLPTFGDSVVRLETHLLHFQGDLYGQHLKTELIDKVRSVQKFASIDELREQIRKDTETARKILAANS